MLRHRLIFGVILAAAMGGILIADEYIGLPYPCLLGVVLLVACLAGRELVSLLPVSMRPRREIAIPALMLVVLANWWPAFSQSIPSALALFAPASAAVGFCFVFLFLLAFLLELAYFDGQGGAILRLASTLFLLTYLAVLPSFLIQIRFLPDLRSDLCLAAAIFVPKLCDIGAYFTGRLFGRTPFTPRLSPKKTWEGFAGGMIVATLSAVGIGQLGLVFRHGIPHAIAFGLCIGLMGVLGDLAESLIKREAMAKDAAASIPGFGGILDVIDSVIFAAPFAYVLLAI